MEHSISPTIAELKEKIESLTEALRKSEEEKGELLAAAKTSRQFYKDELEAIGGCDHSVNICACSIIAEYDDLCELIKRIEKTA